MANVAQRRIRGNLVFHNKSNRMSLLDAIGPDVVKVIDDFAYNRVASDALDGWTQTLVETGLGGESTVTLQQSSGGNLLLTTDNADNDGVTLTLNGESFELTTDQACVYFGIRFKISEATQSDFFVGLSITSTAILGGVTDSVGFRKVDGSTSVAALAEKDSSETETTGVHTMVADAYVTLEFYFDSVADRIYFFADNVQVASISSANIPDDELLTPSIEFLTGTTTAFTMAVDWVRAIMIGR